MKSLIALALCLAFPALSFADSTSESKRKEPTEEETKLALAMKSAVMYRHHEKVKKMLDDGFPVDGWIAYGSGTALWVAVQGRDKEMIKMLLDYGAKPDDRTMLEACFTADRELDIPRWLVEHGGNFNAFTRTRTCLTGAVYYGNQPLTAFLLAQEGIDLDRPGERGTPLAMAIMRGQPEIANALLDAGANPKAHGDERKNSLSAEQVLDKRVEDLLALQGRIKEME